MLDVEHLKFMDGTVASCSVFSAAFLVSGEGELREAELRIDGLTA